MNTKPKIVAVVGPTASGKTGLAIEIAKQFSGEVISADSRQVYRELDIGTAKVTEKEMQGVPHHLIDVADVDEIYTGAQFKRDAEAAILGIQNRGLLPIIAGGTFFYIELLRGTMQTAPVEPDQDFRQTLEDLTNEELLERLESTDPRRAQSIDPHNRRRLIRSLEIIHTLGAVPEQTVTESEYDVLHVGIKAEKDVLLEKFKIRAESWLQGGFLHEIENLLESGVKEARLFEIGFEYALGLELFKEEITSDEFVQKFIEKNWQYAKRQMTWLRKDESIEWYRPENRKAIFGRVEAFLGN